MLSDPFVQLSRTPTSTRSLVLETWVALFVPFKFAETYSSGFDDLTGGVEGSPLGLASLDAIEELITLCCKFKHLGTQRSRAGRSRGYDLAVRGVRTSRQWCGLWMSYFSKPPPP